MAINLRLNEKQIDTVSEILSNIAVVSLASVVLPAMLDRFNLILVIWGSLASIFLWIASIWLRK